MSPIYVRPEREQAEHDRLIRFLQAKYSRNFEALANPGDERVAPVKVAAITHFPDIVLNEDKRLAGLVEIETAASVNNLETMAKWVPFSRARVPFHLYVPVQGYEAALRLAEAHQVRAAEIWTYRPATEGFDLVRMFVDASLQVAKPARATGGRPAAGKAAAAKAVLPKPAPAARAASKVDARTNGRGGTKKAVKASKPAARPASKAVAKTKARPAPKAKPPAARRPATVKRAAKPARTSSARPASKGGKKGAGARKGR